MKISIRTHLSYFAGRTCDVLLQIHAAPLSNQLITDERLTIDGDPGVHLVEGEDGIGRRFWLSEIEDLNCDYSATVELRRQQSGIEELPKSDLSSLPAEVLKYLMPSRYCAPEFFNDFITLEYSDLSGGLLVSEMRDWIERHLNYNPDASTSQTTASESFEMREGVCRDYAHVLIAMARSAAIPARMASVYAPDVVPQDFHAMAEVYLNDEWFLIDPTGMTTPERAVVIGVGRDAADVSFLTSYGAMEKRKQTVRVTRI